MGWLKTVTHWERYHPMDRRQFLQNLALTTTAAEYLSTPAEAEPSPEPETDGHTLICEFKIKDTAWKLYEDLRTRDGALTYVSDRGTTRVLTKSAEAAF